MFNREIDMEGCLQQYIENKLTCSIPWGPRNFSHYPTCETKKQLIWYYKMILKIRFLGERGIYEETGCKSSCHVNIYKLDKRFNFRDDSVQDQVIHAAGDGECHGPGLETYEFDYYNHFTESSHLKFNAAIPNSCSHSFPSRLSSISITMEGNTRGQPSTSPTAQSPSSQTLEGTW